MGLGKCIPRIEPANKNRAEEPAGPRDMSVGFQSQKRVKSQDQKLLLWE